MICFSKEKTYVSRKNIYKINYFKPLISIFSAPISLAILIFIFKNYKKYDCIHFHSPNPVIEIFLIFLPIKKLIVSWHSDIISQKFLKYFFRPFQYLLLKKSHRIICTSKIYANSSNYLKLFNFKTVIIPPILKKKNKKLKKINKKKISILMIGRLVNYKGYDVAINAMNLLPENYELKIIGNGPNKIKLNKQIKI